MIGQGTRAGPGGHPRVVLPEVLDQERDPGEGAGQRLGDPLARLLGHRSGEVVQHRLDGGAAGEGGVEQLGRRHLPVRTSSARPSAS